ncbi:hemerythrin domain-containing protein [Micromonospora sp. WMMD1082]|uniref:hemerythrin domain-containing protein n=1 Tax=Micromonospora sp. WMMD1082 TaxID=3016104 RepID=UPI002415C184|nr:hemerythrin domain-containing protein [Micromonospora sp. WMMD1082]MDG4797399.1 hemerythrin domain-containing protein [Micromonospora sp. WMMD1082]
MSVHLPPLPPTPADGYRPGGRSIADLIAEEHRQLLELTRRLIAPGPDPEHGRDVLVAALSRHLSAEEQYLLPAVRHAVSGAGPLVDEAVAGDVALLRALQGLTDDGLAEVAARLEAHATAVDPLVQRLCDAATEEELIRLGNRLEIAEEAAPTRPHPAAPHTPPWNRIVEPAVGVVDKVRDVLAGRHTQLGELTEPPPR